MPQKVPTPKITRTIGYRRLHRLLREKAGGDATIYLSDKKYGLARRAEVERFLREDKTNLYKYVPEYFDCDDYSYKLMGSLSVPDWASIAFGIGWSRTHAFNIFVDDSEELFVVEPQTDNVVSFERGGANYRPTLSSAFQSPAKSTDLSTTTIR